MRAPRLVTPQSRLDAIVVLLKEEFGYGAEVGVESDFEYDRFVFTARLKGQKRYSAQRDQATLTQSASTIFARVCSDWRACGG